MKVLRRYYEDTKVLVISYKFLSPTPNLIIPHLRVKAFSVNSKSDMRAPVRIPVLGHARVVSATLGSAFLTLPDGVSTVDCTFTGAEAQNARRLASRRGTVFFLGRSVERLTQAFENPSGVIHQFRPRRQVIVVM